MNNFKKIFKKAVPLWLVLFLIVDSSLILGFGQYYLMKRELRDAISELQKSTKSPEELVQILKQEVLPLKGYKTSLKWKNLGKELVDVGAIDKQKYQEIFNDSSKGKDEMKYLEGDFDHHIQINEKNAHFLVNTFWALGLVNKSNVLDTGAMKGGDTENFASTGGWTLGSKEAMKLYSSAEVIKLTPTQQELVKKIAENVFRPCCNNSVAFPDCNHGMAALGYIEYAVKEGLNEKQIYKDLLALNSFWFPKNYIDLAILFDKQNTNWNKVDAKLALSKDYSSAQGAERIKQSIQDIPGFQIQGGGCSA